MPHFNPVYNVVKGLSIFFKQISLINIKYAKIKAYILPPEIIEMFNLASKSFYIAYCESDFKGFSNAIKPINYILASIFYL